MAINLFMIDNSVSNVVSCLSDIMAYLSCRNAGLFSLIKTKHEAKCARGLSNPIVACS